MDWKRKVLNEKIDFSCSIKINLLGHYYEHWMSSDTIVFSKVKHRVRGCRGGDIQV